MSKKTTGASLANTSRGQGTFGLTNADKLKAGKEAARLLLEGTMEENRKERDKAVNNSRTRK